MYLNMYTSTAVARGGRAVALPRGGGDAPPYAINLSSLALHSEHCSHSHTTDHLLSSQVASPAALRVLRALYERARSCTARSQLPL